ncbi:DUF3870 domain-containing protein [Fictibacillus sp. 5RED26]|uniref:DUF3870 domain-containing protein n=1 Tax=Fictibacillus sp. 5RED26 TaxID=2745876 RepID=UPI0018CE4A37|nr:DUF3870 domain-containing protein [Fictibacillus sp. 5RED26]MBH0155699.1 DUF3870 domain-containing protein [Fictibacillus sp. 5RED26]
MLERTRMIAGHAKLPQGMSASEIHQTLTVTIETDHQYWVILNASCTLSTQHAQSFFSSLLKGFSLMDGCDPIVNTIERNYHGKAKTALITAVKDAYKQYSAIRAKTEV